MLDYVISCVRSTSLFITHTIQYEAITAIQFNASNWDSSSQSSYYSPAFLQWESLLVTAASEKNIGEVKKFYSEELKQKLRK